MGHSIDESRDNAQTAIAPADDAVTRTPSATAIASAKADVGQHSAVSRRDHATDTTPSRRTFGHFHADRKLRLLNIITVLGTGGATNVALDIAEHFHVHPEFDSEILSGPILPGRTDMAPAARARGIPVHTVASLVNRIDPVLNARSVAAIRRFIQRGKYDIVHTHTSVAGIVGRIAARAAGTPIIVHHVHGWGWNDQMSRPVRRLEILLERFCARLTDRIVTVSRRDLVKGQEFQIADASKLELIYNGIDLQKYRHGDGAVEFRRELGIGPNHPLVGMIGRLDHQKNPADFIRAAAIVVRDVPQVRFVIVGDGPLQQECEQLIARLGLQQQLFLLGFRSDVPAILSALTLTAMSSLWEGLPLAFMESMSAGKPIVANDIDGVRELVIDDETGYLVAPHQPQQMADRIVRLLRNRSLRQTMGQNAQRHSDRFSLQSSLDQIESMYRELYVSANR